MCRFVQPLTVGLLADPNRRHAERCRDLVLFFRRSLAGLAVVAAAWTLSAGAFVVAAEESRSAFSVPILVVNDRWQGACVELDLTLTRDSHKRRPPIVSIGEDTPGGVGPSLRASVWMATAVSALERSDSLAGTTLTLEVSGEVDGPSGGAALCLAILTALDQRTFPADAAFTGIVMPDGTIGDVEGVAPKMRAAAAHGLKRMFLPAHLRFEVDPDTKEQVDLKRLSETLGLEFIPVENVREAYHALHRLPMPVRSTPGRDVLSLSIATEELLKAEYRYELDEGRKLWETLSEKEQAEIAADSMAKSLIIDRRADAELAYRTGRLLYARDAVGEWHRLLRLRAANLAALKQALSNGDAPKTPAELAELLNRLIADWADDIPNPQGLLAACREAPVDSAQFCADLFMFRGELGVSDLIEDLTKQELTQPADDETSKAERYQAVLNLKLLQMLLVRNASEQAAIWPKNVIALAETVPRRSLAGDVTQVQSLFRSAQRAARNVFLHDVVLEFARIKQVSADQALSAMIQVDETLLMYMPTVDAAQELDIGPAIPGARDDGFIEAALAHAYADSLASVSGLLCRWSILEPDLTAEGELRYQRIDLLNYLLTNARTAALENIAACRNRDICCVMPIAYFEAAELTREAPAADKVDVLAGYWNASLQAKSLLMLFDGHAAMKPQTSIAEPRSR